MCISGPLHFKPVLLKVYCTWYWQILDSLVGMNCYPVDFTFLLTGRCLFKCLLAFLFSFFRNSCSFFCWVVFLFDYGRSLYVLNNNSLLTTYHKCLSPLYGLSFSLSHGLLIKVKQFSWISQDFPFMIYTLYLV